MSNLKKYLEFRKRLAYKLVTSYGLLLILFITIAFNLDKFDARKFSPFLQKTKFSLKMKALKQGKA